MKISILVFLLLCVSIVAVVQFLKNKENVLPAKSDDIEMLETYLKLDEKALNKEEIEELSLFFHFPIYYYIKDYTREEFIEHYLENMSKYKKKNLRIDSIIPVSSENATKYIVYGEQRKYKKNSNTYNVGKIKDEFTLKNAKIVSIIKIDKK